MAPKVLFISHNAGRTGAPIMLLNLLRWLKKNTDLSFEILLRCPGSLQQDFASLAPTHLYGGDGILEHVLSLAEKRTGFPDPYAKVRHRQLLRRLQSANFDLIYSNTVTNGDILETLSPLGCPVLTHIHELDYWIEQTGGKNLEQVLRYSNHFIAASGAVKTNLVSKYGFPGEKIDVVHSFIPIGEMPVCSNGIRRDLAIPDNAFVVLGSGYETWRKGKDLFVLLAAQMQRTHAHIEPHFLWVGGWQKNTEDKRNILHDVQHLGLTGRVHFTGEVNNPLDYFTAGDAFAMVSREDPFPLVCLEAAALGKPVLCFAGAGGMPEFVEDDSGYVVPYLDLHLMAEHIADLARDEEHKNTLGQAAAAKVREKYNLAAGSQRIYDIICRWEG